jgi:2-polyprenyl-3-methyl-5-hydroxy-6-metoxy-1,4-benzoquinol methylase
MLPEKNEVVICENSTRFLGCDGTSGWIWDAARKLEEFLLQSYPDGGLTGLRILELGSGTGWLSLRLALQGAIVTATDRQGAMQCLVRNISANQDRFHEVNLEVDMQVIDWDTDRIQGEWDLVTGSDVVYHIEHHRPLLEACIRHDAKRCIFVWEQRKQTEEKAFVALAKEMGFRVDSLEIIGYNPETLNPSWAVSLFFAVSK